MNIQCSLCQQFDIQALLLQSANQEPRVSRNPGHEIRNFYDAKIYRPPIPQFHAHHENIVALKRSAEQGCNSCHLFWSTWMKTVTKTEIDEEWLISTFPGQMYLGSSGWSTLKHGFPYITLMQQSSDKSRKFCHFEPFAERDSLPEDGASLVGRAVCSDSGTESCLSVAREWLHTCLHTHKHCNPSNPEFPLPTRVIDVGQESQAPKLITSNGRPGTWIALSYCWGGDSTFVFNDRTLHDLVTGIDLGKFPATLHDAVLITRRLGIQYIWIDALCIKQDSASDWATEATKMRDIYSGAVLTIVAANSPSTKSGIFAQRTSSFRTEFEWKGSSSKVYLRPGTELWEHTLQSSPLMGRGWTLQEGLLAPRTLSYGAQQMVWECSSTHQADESGRITTATQAYRTKGFIQQLGRSKIPTSRLTFRISPWWKKYGVTNPYDEWYEIVREFGSRSLTKDTDILPALSGLASAFQPLLNDVYLAGLWKKDLLFSLLWSSFTSLPSDKSTRFDLAKPTEYLAPSWSWASILGKKPRKYSATVGRASNIAKVVKVSTVLKGGDPFGQVSGGQLVLLAPFCKLELVSPVYFKIQDVPTHFDLPMESVFQNKVYKEMTKNPGAYEFYQQHQAHSGQVFGVIELIRWSKAPESGVPRMDFLIVESTGSGEWRRIGRTALLRLPTPNKEDVADDTYAGILREIAACEEVEAEKWKKQRLVLI